MQHKIEGINPLVLPSSGAISLGQANTEMGLSATAPISLNQSNVRRLARDDGGTISMSQLRGKGWESYNMTVGQSNNKHNIGFAGERDWGYSPMGAITPARLNNNSYKNCQWMQVIFGNSNYNSDYVANYNAFLGIKRDVWNDHNSPRDIKVFIGDNYFTIRRKTTQDTSTTYVHDPYYHPIEQDDPEVFKKIWHYLNARIGQTISVYLQGFDK